MNPEQVSILEHNEDVTINQHALEANLPEDLKQEAVIEDKDTESIEHIKQEILDIPEQTAFGTLSPEGVLFEPKTAVPESNKWPSWLRKAAVFTGIVAAGTIAPKTAQAGGIHEKSTNNVENVKSAINESIHEVTIDEEAAWNNFVGFVQSKNLTANPELNHIEFSKKLVAEFNEHAAIPLDWNSIKSIQHGINVIKQKEIAEVKAGRAVVVDQNNKELSVEQLMQNTSPEDGIPGVKTVSYRFPISIDRTVATKNLNFHDDRNQKDYEILFAKDSTSTRKLITPEGDGLDR